MLFNKDTSFLLRAAATANLGAAALLVLVPCAARGLVSLWAAIDSSRLWRVLGRPLDPLGTQALFGMLLGALNMGASLLVVMSRTPRCSRASDFRHGGRLVRRSKCHHESA